jgi:hypothetical protein
MTTSLYHYCNASAFASIIGERRIWLSSLSLSNDTMEGKLVGTTFERLFKKNGVDEKKLSKVMDAVKKLEEVIDGLGFCLSEKGDLLSQWRGYSQDGLGFSIGFSKEYLEALAKKKEEGEEGINLNQVIYEPEDQEKVLQPIFSQIMKDINDGKLDMPYPPTLLTGYGDPAVLEKYEKEKEGYLSAIKNMMLNVFTAMFHLFTLKNHAFQEEQEWRLISYLLKGNGDKCDFRISGNRLTPYRSFPLKKIDTLAINEVILGPKNITPEFVVSKFLQQNGFVGVSVKRSVATYR